MSRGRDLLEEFAKHPKLRSEKTFQALTTYAVGLLFDGERRTLDVYCNRVRIDTIFRDLPPACRPAFCNGLGKTTLRVTFYTRVPKPQPLDQYQLPE